MAKFYGVIGICDKVVVEKKYAGEFHRFTRRWQNGTKVNDDVNLVTQISIIADSYLLENMHCIRYVKINGVAWEVTSIDPQHPRLLLDLGGVYNGETA